MFHLPSRRSFLRSSCITALVIAAAAGDPAAQVRPGTIPTLNTDNPRQDTTSRNTNTDEWSSGNVRIDYHRAWSEVRQKPDTALHGFHRRPFVQPWLRDLGNLGSPVRNRFFTLSREMGIRLGYDQFDPYRYRVDSLFYYNTNRPYSEFVFNLGGKSEQMAQIFHTQNIRPDWNVAVHYRKLTSPGYYKIQRNNHDNAALTTSYKSRDQRYRLFGALAYNKQQHDANGGILADSLLDDERYSDRKTVAVAFDSPGYSVNRSPVTNMHRDLSLLLQHSYTWGRKDTLYNEDSTQYSYHLVPRFSISHRFAFSTEKYAFGDMRPDSARYAHLFRTAFGSSDSVRMDQKRRMIDNQVMLNGFIGSQERQLRFSAGAGIQADRFETYYITGADVTPVLTNYLAGQIAKEAVEQGQWFYRADLRFNVTGAAAGDFFLHGELGRDLGKDRGNIAAGFRQQLTHAPYNYMLYQTAFGAIAGNFARQSATMAYLRFHSARYGISAGFRSHLIGNYIYLDESRLPAQYGSVFNLTQAWIQKRFRLGIWVLDNELTFQQATANAPVHIPALQGRHQLGLESWLFQRALRVATGVEVRYHTAYYADGYDPLTGRFYYQSSYRLGNYPEASVFFNFGIKRFRAYIMGDQLQQFFFRNIMTAPGYPGQDAMLRFGFSWVMIN